jgi:signal peptide peptidase SppA
MSTLSLRRRLLAKLPVERFRHPPPVVAVIPLSGIIGRFGSFGRSLNLRSLAGTIERAFGMPDLAAVALSVNSPGGSPVQSALIAGRIRALAEEKKVPVFAFAEDVAASGGYWLLAAGDELFADESSIVGSIGVVSAGFGFPELLKRLGVERRVYATSEHKAGLDPFRPEQTDEVEHLRAVQNDIYAAFCRQVRERRGAKLKAEESDVFNGRFWSGRAALELGLIDGIGDLRSVMRARFGEKVRLRLVGERQSWWRRRLGLAAGRATPEAKAAAMLDGLAAVIEDRAMWSRYGL